jgi:hypothetical protein
MKYIQEYYRTNRCNAPVGYSDDKIGMYCLKCDQSIDHACHIIIDDHGIHLYGYWAEQSDEWTDMLAIMRRDDWSP